MTTGIHAWMRERLHAKAGIVERATEPLSLAKLEESEWSPAFERLMRNRLVMGALRYGTLARKKAKPHSYDLLGAVRSKAQKYAATGNLELLADIANYCLLEYECGNHPNRHFAAGDDTDHCKERGKP